MMEKNAYTMASLGLGAKEGLQPKRDCGFYMKYFFLFLSLIQFLIILGLVLFMIYSNPLEGTEKHLKGLTNQLQERDKKIKALNEEIGKLKRQVNATEKETRLSQAQVSRLNLTLRLCNNEKAKLKEQQQSATAAIISGNECRFNLQLLNITYVAHVSSLEKQLVAMQLKSQMERDTLSRDSSSWQEKAEKAEKEKNECQLVKLQLQTREQKYQELKSAVMQELGPVLQNLRTSAEQFFSSYEIRGCYRHEIESTFRSVFRNLQTQLETLAQNLDQKINEVTRENSLLQSQKAACKQSLQELDQQIGIQQQQFRWQKQALQETHQSHIQKIQDDCKRGSDENESLKQQLQQCRQACISIKFPPTVRNPSPMGPFGSPNGFPRNVGNPGSLGNPGGAAANVNAYSNPSVWGRPSSPAQPSSGSLRNLSSSEQNRLHEILKAAVESGKLPNPAPVNPVGQPST